MVSEQIPAAENGVAVSQDLIDEWNDAYSVGKIPDGYEKAELVVQGRPRLFDEDMSTVTIRIPATQKEALKDEAAQRGVTISTYVREILAVRETVLDG